jgi:hypothetical protein
MGKWGAVTLSLMALSLGTIGLYTYSILAFNVKTQNADTHINKVNCVTRRNDALFLFQVPLFTVRLVMPSVILIHMAILSVDMLSFIWEKVDRDCVVMLIVVLHSVLIQSDVVVMPSVFVLNVIISSVFVLNVIILVLFCLVLLC